jgi:hypothetical protein
MKYLFTLLVILGASTQCFSSENFDQRLGRFLNKKYSSYLNKASVKLNVPLETLNKKISHQLNNNSLSFSGEVDTEQGICKLEGKLGFIDQNTLVRCISKDLRAKIIFI